MKAKSKSPERKEKIILDQLNLLDQKLTLRKKRKNLQNSAKKASKDNSNNNEPFRDKSNKPMDILQKNLHYSLLLQLGFTLHREVLPPQDNRISSSLKVLIEPLDRSTYHSKVFDTSKDFKRWWNKYVQVRSLICSSLSLDLTDPLESESTAVESSSLLDQCLLGSAPLTNTLVLTIPGSYKIANWLIGLVKQLKCGMNLEFFHYNLLTNIQFAQININIRWNNVSRAKVVDSPLNGI
ncbi:hypothetical protein IEQ34_017259 [Dendrobium chrysotoxum]|uniref:Uncharacterized protein n=1 Tax=Dendrobium chrysotoxum TaxID=161865 RepID=A0AAV7G9S8_DENCH|nr:hypothetical protein IEQ34_017259 [Dendrobium chrysotoxum]